jgi:hypothetical protein
VQRREAGRLKKGEIMEQVIRILVQFIIAFLIMLIFAAYSQAAYRYVSPSGDDTGNDCSSPASPCATLERAIDSAVNFDVIRMARGTYVTHARVESPMNTLTIQGGWDADFTIRSSDASLTVLDGDGDGTVVLLYSMITNLDISLQGIEIRNGETGLGALNIGSTMALEVRNCRIKGNEPGPTEVEPHIEVMRADMILGPDMTIPAAGGGMLVYAMSASSIDLTVANCEIAENVGLYGGIAVVGGRVTIEITDNVIESNISSYGDLSGSPEVPFAGGVSIMAQEGGEITAALARNSILGNGGVGGGGVSVWSKGSIAEVTLENNLIVNNNTTGSGGGIAVRSLMDSPQPDKTTVVLTNNTITGNTSSGASGLGGGMYVMSDDPRNDTHATVTNTILWGNSASDGDDVALEGLLATLRASYSDIGDVQVVSGDYTHNEVVNEDPLFAAPMMGDFHLDGASPLLAAGECGTWELSHDGMAYARIAPEADFEGDLRAGEAEADCCEVQLGCDIGADEYHLLPLPPRQKAWPLEAPSLPVRSEYPELCLPFAAGPVDEGAVDLQVGIPEIDGPADIYLGISVPGFADILLITPTGGLAPLSGGLLPWMSSTTGDVMRRLFGEIPVSSLPAGTYGLYVFMTPAGSVERYYLWVASFEVE